MKVECFRCGRTNNSYSLTFILQNAFIKHETIYAECEWCVSAEEERLNRLPDEIQGSWGD